MTTIETQDELRKIVNYLLLKIVFLLILLFLFLDDPYTPYWWPLLLGSALCAIRAAYGMLKCARKGTFPSER